jgi:MFS family permease
MNPWRGLGRLPKSLWVLGAVTLINRAGTMILPFLVLYLTRVRGVPTARAGLVLAAYGIGALVVAPIAGRLADRIGAERVMELSLVLGGLLAIALPYVGGFWPFCAAVLLWAMVAESFRPANLAAASGAVGPEDRRAAFSLLRLAVNLGMSVGPAAAGFLVEISFGWLFWIDGVSSILAGLVRAANWRAARRISAAQGAAPPPALGGLAPWRNAAFVTFLLALLPVVMVFFQINGAFALDLVRNVGLRESTYGLLFTLNTLIIILLEVPLNLRMAGWAHHTSLALGAFLIGAGFGALAFARQPWGVAASVVVWTFGEMITLPAMSACAADLSPAGRRGEYMGLYQVAFAIAFLLGPWAGTALLDRAGPRVLWSSAFASAALSALIFSRLRFRPAPAPADAAEVAL